MLVGLMVCFAASPSLALQAETQNPVAEADDLMLQQWVKLNPTGSRAKFEMPVKPRFVERTFTPLPGKPPIKTRMHIGTLSSGSYSFVFNYNDLHERPRGKSGVDRTLDVALQNSVVSVSGQLVNEIEKIKLPKQSVPGRQFAFIFQDKNKKDYVVISRVFLKGRRLYQISAVGERKGYDEAVASRFLNSFDAVRPKSDLPPVPKVK